MKRFLLAVTGLSLCMAQAQDAPKKGDSPVEPVVADAVTDAKPVDWKEEDLADLMKGVWWEHVTPLLPEMTDSKTPVASLPKPDDDAPMVDLIPEEFESVNEYFLPEYICKESSLIDPQKLLTEVERQDVLALIDLVKEVYNINLYVSIFARGQKVPASVNAPAVSRQIFEVGKRNLLLHYHVGDIKNVQVALDPDLSARLGDAGRRDLLYCVKQDAGIYTYPQDELIAAMISLVERSRAGLTLAPAATVQDTIAPERAYVPKVNLEVKKPEESKDAAMKKKFKVWGEWALANLKVILGALFALLAPLIIWLVRRHNRVLRLLPSEPDRRLSAPNGASQSRPVNYRTQERVKQDSHGRI